MNNTTLRSGKNKVMVSLSDNKDLSLLIINNRKQSTVEFKNLSIEDIITSMKLFRSNTKKNKLEPVYLLLMDKNNKENNEVDSSIISKNSLLLKSDYPEVSIGVVKIKDNSLMKYKSRISINLTIKEFNKLITLIEEMVKTL